MDMHGYAWIYMDKYGYILRISFWIYNVDRIGYFYGYRWINMDKYGYIFWI
jgi:hypothetical protein